MLGVKFHTHLFSKASHQSLHAGLTSIDHNICCKITPGEDPGCCFFFLFIIIISFTSKDQGFVPFSLDDVRVSFFKENLSIFKKTRLFDWYCQWQQFQSIFQENILVVLFTERTTWLCLKTDVHGDKSANDHTATQNTFTLYYLTVAMGQHNT